MEGIALHSFRAKSYSVRLDSLKREPPAQRIYLPERGGQSLSESFTPLAVF
jgi:hypothetical protein